MLYEAETWAIKAAKKKNLLTIAIDYWRRATRIHPIGKKTPQKCEKLRK